jgi:hypothetical protein
MKTEVYSWRVSPQRKAELEGEAKREGTSLAKLLDEITAHWLEEQRNSRHGDQAEQAAIRKRVMATVGSIHSGERTLSIRAREIVRERVVRNHRKESHASRRAD